MEPLVSAVELTYTPSLFSQYLQSQPQSRDLPLQCWTKFALQ